MAVLCGTPLLQYLIACLNPRSLDCLLGLGVSGCLTDTQNSPSFSELRSTQQVPSDKNTDDQKVMFSSGAFLTPETVKAGASRQHPHCSKKSHLLMDRKFISPCILPWSAAMILGNDNKFAPHLHFHSVSSFLI